MNQWDRERLARMIADGVEEHLGLDYKAAGSLAKTDGKRREVTKDVSAFANSSGGVVIYGVAESSDKEKRHLPERLDPVDRTVLTKEWLEQVIQTIQPRIEGVVIHPVSIDERDEKAVCYVVEIPQSHTAHQARDHIYYKRHNFNSVPMEDYEVRDVMNRKTHPQLQASIYINRTAGHPKPEGTILVRLENTGRVLARHYMVDLKVPLDASGLISVDEPVAMEHDEDGDCYHLRLTPALSQLPLFPLSDVVLRRGFRTNVKEVRHVNGRPVVKCRYVTVTIYADEMPALQARLDIAPVVLGWTPVLQDGGNGK